MLAYPWVGLRKARKVSILLARVHTTSGSAEQEPSLWRDSLLICRYKVSYLVGRCCGDQACELQHMTLGQFKAALAVLDKRYRFPVLHYAGGEVAGRVSFHPEVDYNGLLEVKD